MSKLRMDVLQPYMRPVPWRTSGFFFKKLSLFSVDLHQSVLQFSSLRVDKSCSNVYGGNKDTDSGFAAL